MSTERIQKAETIIQGHAACITPGLENQAYCVLAQLDPDGYPTAATLTVARAEGLREIAFCSGLSSNKAKRAMLSPKASVCFNSADYNITLVGELTIDTDPAVKEAHWYAGLLSHFTGPEDPGFCVLRFRTKRYRLFVDWGFEEGSL